jgi:iron complex outermembrane receptor protein
VNTSLRPESGWNLDIGNRGILMEGRLEYDLTLYSVLLKDLLVTERLAEDVFTGVNAGSAWNRGLEFLVRGQLHRGREPGAFNTGGQLSYHQIKSTFTHFVDEGTDYSGKNLPGIPRQLLLAEWTGELRGFQVTTQYIFTGHQWMDDANSRRYNPYQLVNLRIDYGREISSGALDLKIYGGIRNLFNKHHASMILINAPSFGGSMPRYYYPGSPRYFYLGLGITYHRSG